MRYENQHSKCIKCSSEFANVKQVFPVRNTLITSVNYSKRNSKRKINDDLIYLNLNEKLKLYIVSTYPTSTN